MAAVIQQIHQVVQLAVLVPGLAAQVPDVHLAQAPGVQLPAVQQAEVQVARVLVVQVLIAHQLVGQLAMANAAQIRAHLGILTAAHRQVVQPGMESVARVAMMPGQLSMVIAAHPPVAQLAMANAAQIRAHPVTVIVAYPPAVQPEMASVAHAAMTRDLQTDLAVMTRAVQRACGVTMIAARAVTVIAMTAHLARVAQIATHRPFQITLRAKKSIVQFGTIFAVCQMA